MLLISSSVDWMMVKERISYLEDRSVEISQTIIQIKKGIKKNTK